MRCSSTTRKGKQCPIDADRLRDGEWFCHVHDPLGLFRQQQQANWQDRKGPRKNKAIQPNDEVLTQCLRMTCGQIEYRRWERGGISCSVCGGVIELLGVDQKAVW